MRQIISKEPWWARPPEPGQDELKLEWGWLVHYSEGEPRFEFIHAVSYTHLTLPTNREV